MNLGVLVSAIRGVAAVVADDWIAVDLGIAPHDVLVSAVVPAVDLVVVAADIPPCLLRIAHLLRLVRILDGVTNLKREPYFCNRKKKTER